MVLDVLRGSRRETAPAGQEIGERHKEAWKTTEAKRKKRPLLSERTLLQKQD